jgi:hypothetical protein
MAKIVTRVIYPPIPIRDFDWCAHFDDEEGPTGWGATEQAAIDDLIQNFPREADACPLCGSPAGGPCGDPVGLHGEYCRYEVEDV